MSCDCIEITAKCMEQPGSAQGKLVCTVNISLQRKFNPSYSEQCQLSHTLTAHVQSEIQRTLTATVSPVEARVAL